MTPRLRKLIRVYKTRNPDSRVEVTSTGWLVKTESWSSSLAPNGVDFSDEGFEDFLVRSLRSDFDSVMEQLTRLTTEHEDLLDALGHQ